MKKDLEIFQVFFCKELINRIGLKSYYKSEIEIDLKNKI